MAGSAAPGTVSKLSQGKNLTKKGAIPIFSFFLFSESVGHLTLCTSHYFCH